MSKIKVFLCTLFLLSCFSYFSFSVVKSQENPSITLTPSSTTSSPENVKRDIYIARVADAEEIKKPSLTMLDNTQLVTLEIENGGKAGTKIDTSLVFPNSQFKTPLKPGDKVIVEIVGDISPNSKITLLSKYRQNNLLVWTFILIGLFILVSGFRTNIKYLQIFFISVISGLIVLFLYHTNTFLTFGSLFIWEISATIWFAYNVFRKRAPALLMTLCVLINLLLAMVLMFIMNSINLFDTSFFELFLSSSYDAREVMMYLFAILVAYPLSILLAEQIISESIRKKREENDILRVNIIRDVSRSAIKTLNNIYLTFFGLFFAIFASVAALASRENIVFQVVNTSSLTQILSLGFLILFNILVFIPLVSFAAGMWLGRLPSHELVTDKNLRQLEL